MTDPTALKITHQAVAGLLRRFGLYYDQGPLHPRGFTARKCHSATPGVYVDVKGDQRKREWARKVLEHVGYIVEPGGPAATFKVTVPTGRDTK